MRCSPEKSRYKCGNSPKYSRIFILGLNLM
ncbi:unnamed protein product, partial [Onchocerca ochengi]|uniref:Uncharacterized protein n=1 Tax=Onchocerca ochengi TaxID=42157 RepID=A0A182F0L4_ONCOC